jgi:hypothetical protein
MYGPCVGGPWDGRTLSLSGSGRVNVIRAPSATLPGIIDVSLYRFVDGRWLYEERLIKIPSKAA